MPDFEAETEPDFLITLFGPWCVTAGDASFGALVDHELYHAGQAEDGYGVPRVHQTTGRPIWAIVGHDVEQFVGVVRRWGAGALPEVERMIAASKRKPEIAAAEIEFACGTCRRVA
jgi:hypothetical protein